MERRAFILSLFGSVAAAFTVLRCGSSSSGTPSGTGNCSNGGTVSYTNAGHSHSTVALTAAELTAAVTGAYTLLGGSHSHTFTLTAADFATIASLTSVSKTDLEGHGHTITIVC